MKEEVKISEEHKLELGIIYKCQKDPKEFAVLYQKYYKPIYLYLHKRTENSALTADLCSQVFLKAMSALSKYKYQGFSFSSWLYKIALNELNEHFRRKKIRQHFSIEETGIEKLKLAIEESTDNSEEEKILINALKKLDAEEMQFVDLRFFEEKTFKEIGYILNMTENNAKVRTYRVIDKIRKIILPGRK